MRSFLIQSVLLLSLSFLLVTSASSCTSGMQAITKFDHQEFVFIGKVIGYVGPYRADRIVGEAWGVKIELEDKVFLPQLPSSGNFEVFDYWLGAGCEKIGMDEKYLRKQFVVGAKVWVIAVSAKYLPGNLTNGDLRLEIAPGTRRSITRNDSYVEAETSSTSVFEYTPEAIRNGSRFLFEIRKDLLRLENAKTKEECDAILRRLKSGRSTMGIDYDFISTYYGKRFAADSKRHSRKKR